LFNSVFTPLRHEGRSLEILKQTGAIVMYARFPTARKSIIRRTSAIQQRGDVLGEQSAN